MPTLALSNAEAELVLAALISHSDHREMSARSGDIKLRLGYMRDAWLALRLARRLCECAGKASLVRVMERRAEEVAYRAGRMKGEASDPASTRGPPSANPAVLQLPTEEG